MAAIKGSSYYYQNSKGGVSSVVGYESKTRRVMRTAFTVNDSATKLTVKMKMSAGDVSYRNCQVYMAVSTDSSAYVNHTGTDGTFLGSWSGTATKEATITGLSLVPGTQYYLWFYHYADKYAWLSAYNDNLTLTASDPIYYTITYNPGSYGRGSITAGSQKYGAAFTLTSSTYSRTGYTQTGWSLDTEDGTAEYSIGQSFPAGKSFSRNCTLYPVWTANKYTITFNANGGTLPNGNASYATPSDPSVTYNSSNYSIMDWMVPTKIGYRFLGYYTAASGGTKVYDASGTCVAGNYWNSNKQWIYAGNATFYAHWEKIEYTISFDANGGTVNPTSQVIGYPNGNYNSLPTPTNSGKKFTGWFVDIGNNGPINLGKEYKYPSSSGLTIAFEAYMEDWSTISTATLISCTEGGGWNLWFNNGTLMSEIMTTSSTSYKLIYPGSSGLKASDLKSGWHTFSIAISNTNGIVIEVDKKYLGIESCSGLKYADVASLWLGAEASSNPNSHGGHIFPGLIRNFTIENRATTGIDPIVGSFAIPNQNIILYADWESTNVMFIKVNGQWKCGQTAIKLDRQWVGIEGATMEVEKNIL